jgi:hypothetical protein
MAQWLSNMDALKNFAIGTVSTGYDASATSIVMTTGDSAKFPTVPFNVVWWNWTDYANPADDPNKEIVRCTNIATETWTVTRAQESTSATTKNTGGKTYSIMQAVTALLMGQATPVSIVPATAPAAGQILVGNAGGTAYAPVTVGTDATLAATGAVTIATAAVTLAKMANLAQDQFIGRTTASTGVPETATITSYARQVLDDTSIAAMATTLGLGTASNPQFATIELGAATDTTIARVSAGVISVEAVQVLTVAGGTMTGNITLGENTSVALDPAGSADGKYSGITVTGLAGYDAAFGDLVTLDKDDSRWEAVDISAAAAATGDARGVLGICVNDPSGDGQAVTVLLSGIVRADANFPALTIGAAVFASTSGDIVVAQPTTTDYVIRIVGYALTADEILFQPSGTWTTHT